VFDAVYLSVLQCVALCCSVLCLMQYLSVLQYVAVNCSLLCLMYVTSLSLSLSLSLVLQSVAICCSVLQCIAVYCSVLQCVAGCCSALQCASIDARDISMSVIFLRGAVFVCVAAYF